jgi:DNA-binding NarL/FixJ family response regulator
VLGPAAGVALVPASIAAVVSSYALVQASATATVHRGPRASASGLEQRAAGGPVVTRAHPVRLVARAEQRGARRERLVRAQHVQHLASPSAASRPNRAISQRLFLSVRTVENHVQRLLTKLDRSRRAEVAAALGLDRDPP